MANDAPAPAGSLRVTVCHARPDGAWQRAVTLPAGATVAEHRRALAARGGKTRPAGLL
ncbi:hypothetical protein AZ18_2780 [Bordetella bronchiseptica D993]|uniref:RnfH family protein n=1 Tax=Bordetella bronchiseptica TaxID=518 RepID=UPI00046166BE|nr:RnfH family protein [Bordetella bronchiseptica]KDB97414.1 hypothetical protein AZ18_2780 [Bordetella bronchiseptica D993]